MDESIEIEAAAACFECFRAVAYPTGETCPHCGVALPFCFRNLRHATRVKRVLCDGRFVEWEFRPVPIGDGSETWRDRPPML